MINRHRTRAFIIKKEPKGDSDYIFTAYTRDFGKISFLGKGIRKINAKLKSNIKLFSVSDIEFVQGKTGKKLVGAELIYSFFRAEKNCKATACSRKESLFGLMLFSKIGDTLNGLIKGEEKDNQIWILIKEVCLEAEKSKNLVLLYYYFLWNLFSILGYKINTEQCFFCKKKLLEGEVFFLPEEKGFIDRHCFKTGLEAEQVSFEAIKLIRVFTRRRIDIIKQMKNDNLPFDFLEKISGQSIIHGC